MRMTLSLRVYVMESSPQFAFIFYLHLFVSLLWLSTHTHTYTRTCTYVGMYWLWCHSSSLLVMLLHIMSLFSVLLVTLFLLLPLIMVKCWSLSRYLIQPFYAFWYHYVTYFRYIICSDLGFNPSLFHFMSYAVIWQIPFFVYQFVSYLPFCFSLPFNLSSHLS